MWRSSHGCTAGSPHCHPASSKYRDLESTNGTFVNGQRVDAARLAHGDRLQVGRLQLLVIRED